MINYMVDLNIATTEDKLHSMGFIDSDLIPRTKEEMDWAVEVGYVIEPFRIASDIDVEMLLDYVDLKLDWYVPSLDAIKFINFIRLCMGKEPENSNPKAHYFVVDCFFRSKEVKPYYDVRGIDFDFLSDSIVLLGTREFGKTILVTYLMLYLADTGYMPNFGKVNLGLYVSDKVTGNVVTTMKKVELFYKSSEYLKTRFEEVEFKDTYFVVFRHPRTPNEVKVYNKHMKAGGKIDEVPKRMERMFKIEGIGASGGRGASAGDVRPQFAILDDLVRNDHDVRSEVMMSAIETTIEKDINGGLHGGGNFKILIGTAYAEHDPVYSRCGATAWLPVIVPKAEKPPVDPEYASDGSLIKAGVSEAEFISVWKDRHDYANQRKDYLKAKRDQDAGKPLKMISYLQEFFCRIRDSGDRFIPKAMEQWYDEYNIISNANNYTWVITTDLTTTTNLQSNRAGMFLWAISYDEQWFLVDLKLAKIDIEEQYDTIFDYISFVESISNSTPIVGVEVDGQQNLHLNALRERQYKKNVFIHFARQLLPDGSVAKYDGIKSKLADGDKFWRFALTKPQWFNRKIWLPRSKQHSTSMKFFLDKELAKVTNQGISGPDDGLDCVSQLKLIKYRLPARNISKYAVNKVIYDHSDYDGSLDVDYND